MFLCGALPENLLRSLFRLVAEFNSLWLQDDVSVSLAARPLSQPLSEPRPLIQISPVFIQISVAGPLPWIPQQTHKKDLMALLKQKQNKNFILKNSTYAEKHQWDHRGIKN